ncbi:MAG: efflux RND transporter periplasmic adaptor subunit, partial [Pseudomonadota bacterium]
MPRPKQRMLTIGAVTAIVIAVVAAMASGSRGAEEERDAPLLTVQTSPITVQTAYQAKALYPGRVRAGRRSQLGFERGGRLAAVMVDDAQMVAEGALLAQLDQRQLNAQKRAAQAAIAAAQASLTEAEASRDLASAVQDRQRTLLAKGHIAQQRFDDSTYGLRAAKAAVASAQARLAQARADVDALNVTLALSDLTAPFDGFVVKRMADEGTILAPGAPIFDFEEAGQTEFVSGVPIKAAKALTPGAAMTVTMGTAPYEAVLTSVVPAVDTSTRTAQLVLALPAQAQ